MRSQTRAPMGRCGTMRTNSLTSTTPLVSPSTVSRNQILENEEENDVLDNAESNEPPPIKPPATAPGPSRPLPKHRMNTLSKVKGVEYLHEGKQYIPPVTLHGRILTNIDPRSRERAQKRWDALKDVVSRTPELTRISQKLQESIRVLKTRPSDRKDTDIAHLYSWLMSQENLSPLFQTMPEKMGKNICRELEFLHLRSNEVVVHQGDIGSTCFILISGLVSVFVRTPEEQDKFTRMGLRKHFPPDPSVGMHTETPETSKEEHTMHKSGSQILQTTAANLGSKVATLKPGATFGEICLIEPDSKRTATVTVDSACKSANFIVLSSSSYTKMTSSQKTEGTISDHIAFLNQLHVFRTWSKMQLMRLASSMRFMVFSPQQYMQRKNADMEYLYMILAGEAREITSIIFNQQEKSKEKSSRKKHVEHKVTAELTYIGRNDIACESLVLGRKVQLSPVDVRAETTVYALALSKKLFHLYITNPNQMHQKHIIHTIRVLEQVCEARQKWREARLNQTLNYPDLLIKITSKMMRMSGNICLQCGRNTHISGDVICLFDTYIKSRDIKPTETRQYFHHRPPRPSTPEELDDKNEEIKNQIENSQIEDEEIECGSIRHQKIAQQWKEARKYGISPRRPSSTESTQRRQVKRDIEAEINAVRSSWPYASF